MAQVAFSVRMEEGLKKEFSEFCENVGMNMSTAFVVFAKAAVRERRFPFEIAEYPVKKRSFRRVDGVWTDKPLDEIMAEKLRRLGPEAEERRKHAYETYKAQCAAIAKTLDHDWTLDEVNALIDEARRARAEREAKVNA